MRDPHVFFLHCPQSQETIRLLPTDGPEHEAEFRRTHDAGVIERWEPTGRSTSTGSWSDPMSTRRIEVQSHRGTGLAVGERTSLDQPLAWRIETPSPGERRGVELDRELFSVVVDKALYPSHLPTHALDEWALQIEHFARSAPRSDIVLLEDDPSRGDRTVACLTLTAQARLEAGLADFGFEPEIEARLALLFDDELFPPLRVERRWSEPEPRAADTTAPTSP